MIKSLQQKTKQSVHVRTITLVLSLFVLLFPFLVVASFTQKSATWDEPQHVTAGYVFWRLRDFRLDPEHPPMLRMWATLPLLAMGNIRLDPDGISRSIDLPWLMRGQFEFSDGFLYRLNNADHLLYAARSMIVLLGILLGVLLFCWVYELYGFWPAVVVLGLFCMEPNVLAHSGLVTTDLGATCFIFGTVFFLWRATRLVTLWNAVALVGFFSLAQVSKFSAILLVPIVIALMGLRVAKGETWQIKIGRSKELASLKEKARVATLLLIALALISYAAVWAAYGFRHAPAQNAQFDLSRDAEIGHLSPRLASAVGWVDRHRLLPNAFSQGFLVGQAKAKVRWGFLAGQYSREGWWYYFPAALLVKTPVSGIVLFVAGVLLCAIRRMSLWENEVFALVPILVYLATAMTFKLNIGVRHLLPVFPFAMLVGGKAVADLLATLKTRRIAVLGGLCLFQAFECGHVAPHYLAFFNQLIGGPSRGYEFLVDSNLDWGQDLKELKRWMDQNGVDYINLSYFGSADPSYYGIHCTYLPGSPLAAERKATMPRLPGYVAVSVTNLQGVYLGIARRAFYRPLLKMKPSAVIGYSIHIYWMDQAWW